MSAGLLFQSAIRNRQSAIQKGIVLPHLCGTRKVALKWISPTCNYWTKNI